MADEGDRSRLASVTSIGLEREPENRNALDESLISLRSHQIHNRSHLAGNGIEKGVYDALGEAALLVIVHLNDLAPVRRDLGEMQALGEVDQVENILLEARSTKADGRLEELGADTRVTADGVRNLVDVRASRLADGRKRVDGGDTLGEHRVGRELGELRGPEADGEDALGGDPVSIHVAEGRARRLSLLGLERAGEDTVGAKEIGDGGTLGQELGVGEDVEAAARLGVSLEDGAHGLGGAARNGRFLDDDLRRVGYLSNATRGKLDIARNA